MLGLRVIFRERARYRTIAQGQRDPAPQRNFGSGQKRGPRRPPGTAQQAQNRHYRIPGSAILQIVQRFPALLQMAAAEHKVRGADAQPHRHHRKTGDADKRDKHRIWRHHAGEQRQHAQHTTDRAVTGTPRLLDSWQSRPAASSRSTATTASARKRTGRSWLPTGSPSGSRRNMSAA